MLANIQATKQTNGQRVCARFVGAHTVFGWGKFCFSNTKYTTSHQFGPLLLLYICSLIIKLAKNRPLGTIYNL